MWPLETRRRHWPDGRVRDEYLVLFGLSLGDGWFPLVLILGVAWLTLRPFWPGWVLWQVIFGGW